MLIESELKLNREICIRNILSFLSFLRYNYPIKITLHMTVPITIESIYQTYKCVILSNRKHFIAYLNFDYDPVRLQIYSEIKILNQTKKITKCEEKLELTNETIPHIIALLQTHLKIVPINTLKERINVNIDKSLNFYLRNLISFILRNISINERVFKINYLIGSFITFQHLPNELGFVNHMIIFPFSEKLILLTNIKFTDQNRYELEFTETTTKQEFLPCFMHILEAYPLEEKALFSTFASKFNEMIEYIQPTMENNRLIDCLSSILRILVENDFSVFVQPCSSEIIFKSKKHETAITHTFWIYSHAIIGREFYATENNNTVLYCQKIQSHSLFNFIEECIRLIIQFLFRTEISIQIQKYSSGEQYPHYCLGERDLTKLIDGYYCEYFYNMQQFMKKINFF